MLEHCDAAGDYQRAREHLLFDSLYHNPGVGLELPEREVETVCRLRIPAQGGELVARIGVRKPTRVEKPGSLTTEIEVSRGDAEPELLFSRVFELRPENPRRYFFPPHPEYRIDLSEYAGEEVTLVFRSIFDEGRVLRALRSDSAELRNRLSKIYASCRVRASRRLRTASPYPLRVRTPATHPLPVRSPTAPLGLSGRVRGRVRGREVAPRRRCCPSRSARSPGVFPLAGAGVDLGVVVEQHVDGVELSLLARGVEGGVVADGRPVHVGAAFEKDEP